MTEGYDGLSRMKILEIIEGYGNILTDAEQYSKKELISILKDSKRRRDNYNKINNMEDCINNQIDILNENVQIFKHQGKLEYLEVIYKELVALNENI